MPPGFFSVLLIPAPQTHFDSGAVLYHVCNGLYLIPQCTSIWGLRVSSVAGMRLQIFELRVISTGVTLKTLGYGAVITWESLCLGFLTDQKVVTAPPLRLN